jgi:hypothetical protein
MQFIGTCSQYEGIATTVSHHAALETQHQRAWPSSPASSFSHLNGFIPISRGTAIGCCHFTNE